MSELSIAVVSKALDGLMRRQEVISNNIANAGSAGYRAQYVTFEHSLAHAATTSNDGQLHAIASVRPELHVALDESENRLDLQATYASETSMRYEMLADMLAKSLQIESVVLNSSGK
ncbi:hypothetical protein WJ32_18520 (plasmid) [Burkholderia ubonensis]|uniref:Flagellar basal body rod protein N-terminal domain-containing protein n=1 Tax=Burkholderia ubonensis TaxID=101571 RepID=A0A124RCK1_9BURK|nr:flagellar basal body protein [Burkholderia ubonensis]AOJ64575.1 hypothetical protein WJ32_18520 [Burkholderia ubonensis]KVG71119.1 hypothetical protein WJ33_21240 [Burkholderia ubonensis]